MEDSRSGLKLAIGAMLVVGILMLARSFGPIETTLQYEFESWKTSEKDNLRSAARITTDMAATAPEALPKESPSVNLPVLSMQIADGDTQQSQIYLIDARSTASKSAQVLRLLDLLEVSGIFNVSQVSAEPQPGGSPVVSLRVNAPHRNFETRFYANDVEENLQALLLLRLFKEFAGEPKTVPTQSARAEIDAVEKSLNLPVPAQAQGEKNEKPS